MLYLVWRNTWHYNDSCSHIGHLAFGMLVFSYYFSPFFYFYSIKCNLYLILSPTQHKIYRHLSAILLLADFVMKLEKNEHSA